MIKILFLYRTVWQANEILIFSRFGFVNGYKNNNRSHLFVNYDLDLQLDEFEDSNLFVAVEQVSNDTYLSVFGDNITTSVARPNNLNSMNNKIKLTLGHENYNLSSGFESYENLKALKNSDRYRYILPYYNFDTVFGKKFFDGSVSLSSSGSNNLNNTNDLKLALQMTSNTRLQVT